MLSLQLSAGWQAAWDTSGLGSPQGALGSDGGRAQGQELQVVRRADCTKQQNSRVFGTAAAHTSVLSTRLCMVHTYMPTAAPPP